jgi:hypothetical protein
MTAERPPSLSNRANESIDQTIATSAGLIDSALKETKGDTSNKDALRRSRNATNSKRACARAFLPIPWGRVSWSARANAVRARVAA